VAPDQALERKPSKAWARKILALITPKNAVTVSIIASLPVAARAERTPGQAAQSKGFLVRIENRRRLMI